MYKELSLVGILMNAAGMKTREMDFMILDCRGRRALHGQYIGGTATEEKGRCESKAK